MQLYNDCKYKNNNQKNSVGFLPASSALQAFECGEQRTEN